MLLAAADQGKEDTVSMRVKDRALQGVRQC